MNVLAATLAIVLAAASATPDHLPSEQANRDLLTLQRIQHRRHSYFLLHGPFAQEPVTGAGIPVRDFAIRVQTHLTQYGDGHAGVEGFDVRYLDGRCATHLVGDAGGRLVAFRADRGGFLDDEHPYLVSIDGVPVEQWLAAATPLVVNGSPQLVRERSIRMLRRVAELRSRMGLPDHAGFTVGLESADGSREVELARELGGKPIYGQWPRTESRLLDGNIGYLRIPKMRDRLVETVHGWMDRFRETDGLIIDVRGNSGGSRSVLVALFPHFLPPETAPHVANVAAYRRDPDFAADHLADRHLFRRDDPRWTPRQRDAIDAAAARFEPEWPPTEGMFSDWHYMVLERDPQRPVRHYDRPVVILMDSVCFSATDVFLGAFKGWPGVTLMGTPSAGGSGRALRLELPGSGIRVRLSSMASFRPGGRLYDGNGIQPDVVVEPAATDLIGRTDTVLEAAEEHLGRRD